ncbi:MAG: hypothetical protein Q4F13_10290 [Pseudomonadota bacterium]|nr:hypothetical protein [Pseudomonadota bacterium]
MPRHDSSTQAPHYLVELYTPNAAWQALSRTERQGFVDGIRAGMGALAGQGIELLTLAETCADLDHGSGHRYLGIWRFADPAARSALLAGIAASGWYGYFDHVNAACGTGDMAGHLSALLAAPPCSAAALRG